MSNQNSLKDIPNQVHNSSQDDKNDNKWRVDKLRNLLSKSEIGVWGDEPLEDEEGVKVLRAGNYKEVGIDMEDLAYRSISEGKQESKELAKGDIVVERSGGSQDQPVGRVLFFDLDQSNFYPGNFLQLLRPKTEKVNNRYLYDQLNYRYWRGDTKSVQSNTTNIRNLQVSSYLNWDIPLPELSEQVQIASILHNVDQAIQKTEEIIEQTQRVKKGLMQDLFTEGYFEHKKNIQTPAGEMPKGWKLTKLGKIASLVSGDSFSKELQGGRDGIPVFKVEDMNTNGNEKLLHQAKNRLANEIIEAENFSTVPKGSVILPKVGAALLTDKRRITTEQSSFDNNIMSWVPEEVGTEYLYHFSNTVKMEAIAQKGAVPSISKSIAEKIPVKIPPKKERQKISATLKTVDNKIHQAKKVKRQFQRVKKGLMQDLLTGKVRTNEDVEVLEEVVEYE